MSRNGSRQLKEVRHEPGSNGTGAASIARAAFYGRTAHLRPLASNGAGREGTP